MRLHENIRGYDSRTRHPESYSAPAQLAAEHEVAQFISSLVKLIKPNHVLELGTAFGHTSEVIGKALLDNGFGALDTIDINKKRLAEARARCSGLPVNIYQADYKKWKPTNVYDLVFCDSDRENRDKEYLLMEPYLSPDAVLLFHDVGDNHKISQKAMDRLPLQQCFLPCPRGLTIASHTTRGDNT